MKYLAKFKEEVLVLFQSDMLVYAALPIWFWVYAILFSIPTFLSATIAFKILEGGFNNFVVADIILCLISGFSSYMISPVRLFLLLDDEKEECDSRKKMKKFYVLLGQIMVVFIWLLVFLLFCWAMHIANTGTI